MGLFMITISLPKFQMTSSPFKNPALGMCAVGLSKNEINNMLYMFLRFGYKFNSEFHSEPINSDIMKIMKLVGPEPSKEKLISETVKFVKIMYDLTHLEHYGLTPELVEKNLEKLYNQFFMLPDSLRDNLGDDAESHEFLDKN